MGVHGLKPLLPQKRIRDVWIAFPGSELRIDAANLLFRLALRQSRVFVNKNYYPAVAAFQRHMQYLRSRNVLFHMVFDGITRPEKCHEDNRRKERRKTAEENISRERESAANPDDVDVSRLVSNNSLYIALCVKVCSFLLIPFTVAPFEADSQLPKAGCVVVSSDSDMLVLGVSAGLVLTTGSLEKVI